MGGCSKKVQSGPALNWKPSDPERQKKLDKIKENQWHRALMNLRRAGIPVQWSSDVSTILAVCDRIKVEDNGHGLRVFVENNDVTDQIAYVQLRLIPGRDPQIQTVWKPRPFVTTTSTDGRVKERDKVR